MLKTLLSVRFKALLSGMVGKSKDGKVSPLKTVGMGILIAILILCFAVIVVSISAPMALLLVPVGKYAEFFGIMNVATFSIVFIFSIFETKSELFDCKDNELLLSMPIRPIDIIISRSATVLILNALEALFIMVPASILFVVFGGSGWYIPTSLVVAVLVSVLSTVLASAVGYLVAIIAKRFRNNSFVTLGVSLFFLFAYFFGYSAIMNMMLSLEESDPEQILDMLSGILAPFAFLGRMSLFEPLYIIGLVLICVLMSALAWYILSRNYIRIITASTSVAGRKYKAERLNTSSALIALSRKEIAAFLAEPTYMLNGAIGVIFSVLLGIFALISGGEIAIMIDELALTIGVPSEGLAALAIVVIVSSLSAFNGISASAISIEGKRFWIVKCAPISSVDLLYAKLVPHLVLCVPASLILSVLLGISLGASPIDWLFIIVTPIVATFSFAMLGIIFNAIWPKLEYQNIAEVVKNSLPVFLSQIIPMLLLPIFIVGVIFCSLILTPLVTEVLFLALQLVLFLVFYLLLVGPIARRVEKMKP